MKVGDLVQIKHNEHKGVFVVLEFYTPPKNMWAVVFSLRKGEECVEMARSLEVIDESR
jgi:hypothetical protein